MTVEGVSVLTFRVSLLPSGVTVLPARQRYRQVQLSVKYRSFGVFAAALFGFGVTQSNGNNDEGCTAELFSWQEGNLPDPSISEASLRPLD